MVIWCDRSEAVFRLLITLNKTSSPETLLWSWASTRVVKLSRPTVHPFFECVRQSDSPKLLFLP